MSHKFRKWQMFNIGLNNLLLLVLIFFFLAQFLLAFTFLVLKLLCPSAPSAAGREKKSLPYLFLMYFHWSSCLSPGQELNGELLHVTLLRVFSFTSLGQSLWDRPSRLQNANFYPITITAILKEWRGTSTQAEQGSSEETPVKVGYIHKA